ncbi:hypothetical protein FF1_015968 [Malus domestica]
MGNSQGTFTDYREPPNAPSLHLLLYTSSSLATDHHYYDYNDHKIKTLLRLSCLHLEVPKNESAQLRLSCLHSQVIGAAAEFDSPFGDEDLRTTLAIKMLQEMMGIAVPSTLRDKILGSDLIGMEERWLVFVGPYEHHSNLLLWRQSLAQVIEIGLDGDGLLDMEALRLQLLSYKYANRPIFRFLLGL